MPTLGLLGAIDTVLLVAVLALVGGLLLSGRRWLLPLAALGAGARAPEPGDGRCSRSASRRGSREQGILFSRWNSFSRVTVVQPSDPDRQLIFIDSDAATVIYRDGSDVSKHPELRDRVEGLAYHLGGRDKVLIIGPGGGVDVIIARLNGARDVTAVELNPLVARDVMSSEPFLGFSGRLYQQPGVRLVVDDGRSFLRRSRDELRPDRRHDGRHLGRDRGRGLRAQREQPLHGRGFSKTTSSA